MAEEAYQSLYRRFRPGRFSEVLGQEHVTKALLGAVSSRRVGHAYLFSGPRGTGKTSTARILGKALNCTAAQDGEPCCKCASCLAVAEGTSLDVHELDAASNNGVDAMRDLVARAALSTPGEWKVYIIDEVHMLSTAASNALLKTLEEPPGRVVFVLATTDPQKVLPTIRSRTQHFEFHLLGPELLGSLVGKVAKDAGLDVADELIPSVVRRARGSARDALSALDQASAGGGLDDSGPALDKLIEAISGRRSDEALAALAALIVAGRDPQVLAVELLEGMRLGFLASFSPDLVELSADERAALAGQVQSLGLASLVRSMEVIGRALVEMRSAIEPRITLEVALVRITHPEVDSSPEAILERLERLERGGGGTRESARLSGIQGSPKGQTTAPQSPVSQGSPKGQTTAPQSPVSQGSPKGQTTAPQSPVSQGSPKGQTTAPQSPVSQGSPKGQTTAPQSPQGAEGGASSQSGDLSTQRNVASGSASFPPVGARKMTSPGSATRSLTERYGRSAAARYPSREELTKAWGDGILASLGSKARIRFKPGRFVEGDEGTATFALPSKTQLSVCEPYREEVQSALNSHFSVKFDLVLVCDTEPSVIGDAPKGAASKTTRGPVKHADQPKQPSPPEHDTDSEEAILSNPGDLLDEDGARARAEELVVTQFPGAIEIT